MKCEMTKECEAPASYIDEKGFIYCEHHGQQRQSVMRCRKMTEIEQQLIQSVGYIKEY